MTILSFPSTLRVSNMRWSRMSQDVVHRSIFGVQGINGGYPLWKVAVTFDQLTSAESGPYQALLMQLEGNRNHLALHNVGRPAPIGTMRGSPTLASPLAAGVSSMDITAGAGQANTTLKAGDYLGLGSGYDRQVVMVTSDVTLSGTGTATVSFAPANRTARGTTDPVVWDKPTALFRQQQPELGWDYSTVVVSGSALDLLEDWRI
jgi:hypothetical protein